MNQMAEVGQVYKLVDANPPAFGKVKKIIEQQVWNEDYFDIGMINLALGDWYQWVGEEIYCLQGAGFEVTRLIKATSEEIAIYEQQVAEYKESEGTENKQELINALDQVKKSVLYTEKHTCNPFKKLIYKEIFHVLCMISTHI